MVDIRRWRTFRKHEAKLLDGFIRRAGANGIDKLSANFAFPVLFEKKGVSVVGRRAISDDLSKTFDLLRGSNGRSGLATKSFYGTRMATGLSGFWS